VGLLSTPVDKLKQQHCKQKI